MGWWKGNDALRVLCSSVQEASGSAVGCALTGPRARNLAQFDAHEAGAKEAGNPSRIEPASYKSAAARR